METLIRKARKADIKYIKQLELDNNLGVWSQESYESEIERPDSLFYVAFQVNKSTKIQFVTGFLLARRLTITEPGMEPVEVEIYNLAVANRFRRKHIGTQLLNKLVETETAKTPIRIHLEARKSNSAAIEFYKRNGFIVTGERSNFYANPVENALLMCLSPSQPEVL